MTPDAALSSQATDVDKRLAQQASRLWNEIVQRRYDYGRPWRTALRFIASYRHFISISRGGQVNEEARPPKREEVEPGNTTHVNMAALCDGCPCLPS